MAWEAEAEAEEGVGWEEEVSWEEAPKAPTFQGPKVARSQGRKVVGSETAGDSCGLTRTNPLALQLSGISPTGGIGSSAE